MTATTTATTFVLFGKLGGAEFNYGPITKDEATRLAKNRYAEFKDNLKPGDFVTLEDKETGKKAHYRPTKNQLVRCRNYAWVITKDFSPDPDAKPGTNLNAVGVVGPRFGLPYSGEEIQKHPKAVKFRLCYDASPRPEVAYEGYMLDEDGEASGFEPNDDFGERNVGTTTVQLWEKGRWATL